MTGVLPPGPHTQAACRSGWPSHQHILATQHSTARSRQLVRVFLIPLTLGQPASAKEASGSEPSTGPRKDRTRNLCSSTLVSHPHGHVAQEGWGGGLPTQAARGCSYRPEGAVR